MKCAVYVRVSTEEQAKEDYSLAAQIDKIVEYIKGKGWVFTRNRKITLRFFNDMLYIKLCRNLINSHLTTKSQVFSISVYLFLVFVY